MLRTLRRTLHFYPELGESVLRVCVQADGSPYRVLGPGTALRAVLKRNDWSIDAHARLRGPGNCQLSLRTCSSRDIKVMLAQAWAYRLRTAISHRNGLASVGVPDVGLTTAVLKRFSASQQLILARHLSGSFQTAAVKVLWHASESDRCPWCGAVETRFHRFVECPRFEAVRAQHPLAVSAMVDVHPHWVFSPFATLPDATDVVALVFATRPHPRPPVEEAALLQQEVRPSLCFYTDGTCQHPRHFHARHAAWSVCLDSARSLQDQEAGVQFWYATGMPPPTFQTRSCGLVSGSQTIARAELTAAMQAIRLAFLAGCPPTTIVTDSSYVVRILSHFQAGTTGSLLDSSPNLDLIQLIEGCWFSGVTVSKVKAHQAPEKAGSRPLMWQRLGNAAADLACARALENDMEVVRSMVSEIAQEQDEQQLQLHAVFTYLLALNTATQALRLSDKGLSSGTPSDCSNLDRSQDARPFPQDTLRAWVACRTATAPSEPLPAPHSDAFVYNSWGPAFAWRLWHWAQTLQWTSDEARPMESVSTLELFCDFVCTTASLPPLVVHDPQGRPRHVPFTDPCARLCPRTIRGWLHALTTGLRQLERATSARLLGGFSSRKVTSLAIFGDTQTRGGFTGICRFANPQATATLLQATLQRKTAEVFWEFVVAHSGSLWQVPHDLVQLSSTVTPWRRAQRKRR